MFQAEHRAAEEVGMGRCLAVGLKHFLDFTPIAGRSDSDYSSNGLTQVVMLGCCSTACGTSKQDLPLGGMECCRKPCCMATGDGSSSLSAIHSLLI